MMACVVEVEVADDILGDMTKSNLLVEVTTLPAKQTFVQMKRRPK